MKNPYLTADPVRRLDYAYPTMVAARLKRREFILRGFQVGLLSYDPAREVYTFQVDHADPR